MATDWEKRPDLRRIQAALPAVLVSTLDINTPTHRSRSAVIAEAIQEYLERRGIEVPGDYRGRWTVSGNPSSEPGF